MNVLFALPGLHRYNRGAEVAFIAVARELARSGDQVTLIGSGEPRPDAPYRFLRAPSMPRERFHSFPSVPALRNETSYEELTFVPGLCRLYRPSEYDVTVTCSYPFSNWVLRRPVLRGRRPPHVFVTQNGDWPSRARNSEYRFFGCEGLVCTNPDFYERNKDRWRCRLIPNGVDCDRFLPGPPERELFQLPTNGLIVLMVSALISSKRVELGIEAVSRIPGAHLVVAGDGPLRHTIDTLASRLLPGRFTQLTVAPDQMPALYRSCDVFLHLSLEESFGNVFLEAMACGLPVVAPDTERVRWIVGDDERLFGSHEADQVAVHIAAAVRSQPHAREARTRKVANFSWARVAKMYREFLNEIVMSQKPA